MFGKNEIIQRRNLDGVGLFFVCATLISWGVWIPMALSGSSNQGWLWLVVVAVVWRERRLFFKRPVKVDAV